MKKIKKQLILLSIIFIFGFIFCGAVSAVQYTDVAVNSIDCAVSSDGATAEFSVNIENKGSIAAQNVVLRDKMAGVDISNSQYSINNGPWQDWNKNYINLGTMAAGATMLVEFKAPITSNTLINKAELTTTTPEFNRYNNRLSYTTQATYTITSSSDTGGTINPIGNVNIVKGYSKTFTITPDTGYVINDVLVDGISQGPINTYTFNNVQTNHTINATFITQSYAYVTNHSSDTVSVINTATNTVTNTIPVGVSPTGVAITPDGSKAYITNLLSNTVSVIDTTTNTVTNTIPVGVSPTGVAITPDGTKAYVTNSTSDTVSVINTATNTVIATIPIEGGPIGSGPWDVAITPDGSKAYVTNEFIRSVSVINTTTNTVTATIPVGQYPKCVAITPDGTKAYVTNQSSDTVSVINTATNTVTNTIPVGEVPWGVAITPDGTKAYAANFGDNTVSVIDTTTNTVTFTITEGIGMQPTAQGKFIG